MPDVIAPQDVYLTSFQALQERLADREPEWLQRLRQEAIHAFAELGFPTTRHEEWKYTSVAPIAQTPFQTASEQRDFLGEPDAAALEPWRSFSDICLVFVNGSYCEPLSSLPGLPAG